MFKIPLIVLDKLKCIMCKNYLSRKPINLCGNHNQICGVCYEQLTDKDKSSCIHLASLEAVLELALFPCKYISNGCKFEYVYNEGFQHESQCCYSNNGPGESIPYKMDEKMFLSCLKTPGEFHLESKDLHLDLNYTFIENTYHMGSHHLKYNFELGGNNNCQLNLLDADTKMQSNNISIKGEGALALNNPQVSHVYHILEIDNHIHNKINELICNNCHGIIKETVHKCLFGHDTCYKCRGEVCMICHSVIMKESRTYCKNRPKGCQVLEHTGQLNKHEIDCEFNEHICPFADCSIRSDLLQLKRHVLEKHEDTILKSNNVSDVISVDDKVWYLYCFDNLFVCIYYYYESYVEFIVRYIGAHDFAQNFKYQVIIPSTPKYKRSTRRFSCAGWNNASICAGIQYKTESIVKKSGKRIFHSDVKIKITQACR